MLLTRASEYALLSLDFLQKSDAPLGVEQIANELYIPKNFLAKILQGLAKHNVLESRKGAHGGFILTRDLSEISVREVIFAAEGKYPAVFDCTSYTESCPNGSIGNCAISPFLVNFQTKIDDFLDGLMIGDIL